MTRHRLAAAAVAALLVAVAVAPVAASTVIGLPALTASAADNRVTPGQEATLDVFLTNDGRIQRGGPSRYEDRVTTARATRFTVEDGGAPVTVKTGERSVGTVPVGTSGPHAVRIAVDDGATPGVYRLPVEITYQYTRSVEYAGTGDTEPEYNDATRTVRSSVEVVVEDRAYFSVVDGETDVAVGDTGTYALTLRNDGSEPARDARVTVRSPDPAIALGNRSLEPTAYVGDWPTGATRTVSYRVGVDADAVVRGYGVEAQVLFDDASGIERRSRPLTSSLTPAHRASVAVEHLDADLAVGAVGRVSGTVRNTGPPLRDAVLSLHADSGGIRPVASGHALGDLGRNATASFDASVNVSQTAEAGDRRLTFDVAYRNAEGDRRRARPASATVRVGARDPRFAVTPTTRRFTAGDDGRLHVAVRNTGDAVTEVRATATADDPIAVEDATSYLGALDAGANATATFALDVDNDAVSGDHAVDVRFSYRDRDGVQRRMQPTAVPVDVVEPATSVPVVPALVVLAVAAVAVVWWRRRT